MNPSIAGYLPAPLSRLFGREEETTRILQWLAQTDTRLLTLTGLGGSGKTRLALAALRQRPADDTAVWFISLASLADASRIPDAILQTLRLAPNAKTPPLDQVVAALCEQPALLVLDNFEHLAEEGALVVQTLLERVPDLRCLVTPRQPLCVQGEQEFPVFPLLVPQHAGTPERLLEFPSVTLFVDRAQAANLDFELTPENARAVAALCQRLDGVPLAIELAAAWASILTPPQILKRLAKPFDLLVNSNRDIPARHASLRATLDWSYALLTPSVQKFFTQLSVFRGGWTAEAAEAVCEEPKALEYLRQLQQRSLLVVEEGAEFRFAFLETLREYAGEQLSAEEQAALAERHALYFCWLAQQAKPRLRGPDALQWLDRLQEEHANTAAALRWCLESGNREIGLQMAEAQWIYWEARGHYEEGYDWLRRFLPHSEGADADTRASALIAAGNMAVVRQDYPAARAFYEEALELRHEQQDERGIAAALSGLAIVATRYEGNHKQARILLEESLSRYRHIEDKPGITGALNNLSTVLLREGDLTSARALKEDAVALYRELGDGQGLCGSLGSLANIVLRGPDYASARPFLVESLHLAQELASPMSLAYALYYFAILAWREGNPYHAAQLIGATEALRERDRLFYPPAPEKEYRKTCAQLRAELGMADFEAAWIEGREMALERAIQSAFDATD